MTSEKKKEFRKKGRRGGGEDEKFKWLSIRKTGRSEGEGQRAKRTPINNSQQDLRHAAFVTLNSLMSPLTLGCSA